jgi:hypothetical protein
MPYTISHELGYTPTPSSSRYHRAAAHVRPDAVLDPADHHHYESLAGLGDHSQVLGGARHWQSINAGYEHGPATSTGTDFATLARSMGGRDALSSLICDSGADLAHTDDDSVVNSSSINALICELMNPPSTAQAHGKSTATDDDSDRSGGGRNGHDDSGAFLSSTSAPLSSRSMVEKLNALL